MTPGSQTIANMHLEEITLFWDIIGWMLMAYLVGFTM